MGQVRESASRFPGSVLSLDNGEPGGVVRRVGST